MNTQSIVSSMLASVMTIMLALPGAARADGGPYGYGRYEGGGPYHAPFPPRYYPGNYPRYYPHYYPRYYPNYYPNYACKNCDNKHHHDNHDHDYDVWYGLLGGGVLGYTLGNIYPVPQH